MCGIDLLIGRTTTSIGSLEGPFVDKLRRRGPDVLDTISITINSWTVNATSSVLHLRGDYITSQPVSSERFVFLWNGEVYDGIDIPQDKSDTEALFDLFSTLSVYNVFNRVRGEYAFVLVDKFEQTVYFGRDYFGRRSLVFNKTGQTSLRITSIVPRGESFSELPAKGIWWLDLGQEALNPFLIQWSDSGALRRPVPRITRVEQCNAVFPVEEFMEKFKDAVSRRVNCSNSSVKKRIAILFSGGVDSLLVASIAHLVSEASIPIDLLNVAFENQRFAKNNPDMVYYDTVPDRITGLRALDELRALFPARKWNFVRVNIARAEYDQWKEHVLELMRPADTVMDLSIAIALWFAARGRGFAEDDDAFASDARVILVGMGADEQLGGYSRHRSAFEKEGRMALLEEMQMEIDRISERNLGRDDRCISDHSKEARFPFLDEDFVTYLCNLPVEAKCDLSLPRGQGEKRLLRLVLKRLGFSDPVAFLPKRAIQFGAKTAKMLDSQETGTDKI